MLSLNEYEIGESLIFRPYFHLYSIKNKNNVLKIWLVPTCFCYFAPDLNHHTPN
jgi:hypothetical protein